MRAKRFVIRIKHLAKTGIKTAIAQAVFY